MEISQLALWECSGRKRDQDSNLKTALLKGAVKTNELGDVTQRDIEGL